MNCFVILESSSKIATSRFYIFSSLTHLNHSPVEPATASHSQPKSKDKTNVCTRSETNPCTNDESKKRGEASKQSPASGKFSAVCERMAMTSSFGRAVELGLGSFCASAVDDTLVWCGVCVCVCGTWDSADREASKAKTAFVKVDNMLSLLAMMESNKRKVLRKRLKSTCDVT